jgi:hypothetical protein
MILKSINHSHVPRVVVLGGGSVVVVVVVYINVLYRVDKTK